MSTFSPSLRIELITTGDQAGVWGNTTNTNLGTLVESAIAGYTSVSVISANQAFTALYGAADQSRNMTIALTTITGAAFNVYAPPAEKTYVIYNASPFAATIFNSDALGNTTPAGAGVVIPANKTMTVWSDGTNFAFQNTHIVGTVVGDLTGNVTGNVTGNLNGNLSAAAPTAATQTFGDSSTAIATTAFVQAVLQQAVYPVGSIYINAGVTTNPATLLGFGTWVAFGAGRVMVGLNGSDALFDTLEETGGSKDATLVSHTHTATSTVTDPGHLHAVSILQEGGSTLTGALSLTYSGVVAATQNTSTASTGITVATTNALSGSSATNANLQPYITVAMWKRTA